MVLGFTALFAAGFIFGLTDVVLKKIQTNDNTLIILISRSLVSVVGLLIIYVLSIPFSNLLLEWKLSVPHPDLSCIPIAVLLCAISYFGLFFFMQALKYKSASETVGLNKIELIIAIVIGVFLYKENISVPKIICILLIVMGVFMLERSTSEKRTGIITKGLFYILLARICWSVGLLFIPLIKALGVLLFSLIMESVVLLLSIIIYLFKYRSIRIQKWNAKSIMKPIVLIGILGIAGEILANISRANLPVILLALLSLSTPITVLLLAQWKLHERLGKIQWLGIGLGILGSLVYLF